MKKVAKFERLNSHDHAIKINPLDVVPEDDLEVYSNSQHDYQKYQQRK